MIKEMVLNGGLKLFWPVTISASPTDLQHSTRDNIWIMAKRGNDFMLYVLKGIAGDFKETTILYYIIYLFDFTDSATIELVTREPDITLSTTKSTGKACYVCSKI